jgi:hypothetical protein
MHRFIYTSHLESSVSSSEGTHGFAREPRASPFGSKFGSSSSSPQGLFNDLGVSSSLSYEVLPSDDEPSSSLPSGVASCQFSRASLADIDSYDEERVIGTFYNYINTMLHSSQNIYKGIINYIYIHLKTRLHCFFICIGCRDTKSEEKYKIVQEKYKIIQEKYKI